MVRTASSCTQQVSFQESKKHLFSCDLHCFSLTAWGRPFLSSVKVRFLMDSVTPELIYFSELNLLLDKGFMDGPYQHTQKPVSKYSEGLCRP